MTLKDAAVTIAIFLIFLNAVPNLLIASGFAEDAGFDPSISGDNNVGEAQDEMRNIEPSGGFAGTLFQLYTSVTGPVKVFLEIVAGGPLMLASIGVPSWILDFIFAPQYFVIGGAIIYSLSGRLL